MQLHLLAEDRLGELGEAPHRREVGRPRRPEREQPRVVDQEQVVLAHVARERGHRQRAVGDPAHGRMVVLGLPQRVGVGAHVCREGVHRRPMLGSRDSARRREAFDRRGLAAGATARLPVRRVHPRRGPVRRRRHRRRRRGLRHGRGGVAAYDAPARDRRHRLARPQRRDPPRRQHEPALVARAARHRGRLRHGCRPRPHGDQAGRGRGLAGGRRRARGARAVGRRAARRQRRHAAARGQDDAVPAVAREPGAPRAHQGRVRGGGDRDPVPAADRVAQTPG